MSTQLTTKEWLQSEQLNAQIQQALPAHVPAARFMRCLFTAFHRVPKLMDCDRKSLFSAIITAGQLGIEPDGRRAHLIPFKDRERNIVCCQLIVDYKGLVELVMRSGDVETVHADVVCESDVFDVDMGQITSHKINYKEPRGDVYAAYAVATMKSGAKVCEVMTKDEIEAIRNRSKSGKVGPWTTDWREMAKKTVFRRLSKWLPLSPEIQSRISVIDEQEFDKAGLSGQHQKSKAFEALEIESEEISGDKPESQTTSE